MSVTIDRVGWLQVYKQMRAANSFLSRMFTIKPGGVFMGSKVAIDVQRFGEDVAIAITKCSGANMNDFDVFTTKEFEPPTYGEAFGLDVCDLLERMAGVDPYSAAYQEYAVAFTAKMAQGFVLVDDKIKRAVELQASQILQTGKLDLTNAAGVTVYEVDYKPKATHFPTAAIDWDQATSTKLADLASLCDVIAADGKTEPTRAIFGGQALALFLADEAVQAALDNRRMELGEVAPQFVGSGAVFVGHVWVNASRRLEMWTYSATYTNPVGGAATKYWTDDIVGIQGQDIRLDMAVAKVPLPLGPDPRVASLLPGRMTSTEAGFDMTPNVYCTANGKQVMGELESKPLLIPVQIDGFGALNTIA